MTQRQRRRRTCVPHVWRTNQHRWQIASNLEGVTNTVPPKVDVLVVGGGPAGSAAAISLAQAGRAVTVVDKATFP
ncbi:MAG: FAD-dependent oxidoreductase, partial [Actinobacteria bacterium]|nr:FAD-dependent oxidoreductase [Actinomycetota bacterium]